jgi:hypothetical protein
MTTKRLTLVIGVVLVVSSMTAQVTAQTFRPPIYSPRVITVRPDGVDKIVFRRGERIVVLGEGFPKLAPAYIFFRQSSERLLATINTTRAGTFRTDVHVPFDATAGPAVIRGGTFAKISAVANITVIQSMVRTIPSHDRDIVLLGGGGAALVVVGAAMTCFVWWRRRRFATEPPDDHSKTDASSSAVAKLQKDVASWKKG